jgi:hypothetical protein
MELSGLMVLQGQPVQPYPKATFSSASFGGDCTEGRSCTRDVEKKWEVQVGHRGHLTRGAHGLSAALHGLPVLLAVETAGGQHHPLGVEGRFYPQAGRSSGPLFHCWGGRCEGAERYAGA